MQGKLNQLRLYHDSLEQAAAFHEGVIHQLNNAVHKEHEVICIYLHSGNNCIKWSWFFLHLPSFLMNSSGISPYSTLDENQNPLFHTAVMNPIKLVCLSTVMKTGVLFQGILCGCHVCVIPPHDFSQYKGRYYNRWCLWVMWFVPRIQGHLLLPCQAGDYTGMPVQVQPALL